MKLKELFNKKKESSIDSLIKEGNLKKIVNYIENNDIYIKFDLEKYLILAIQSKNSDFLEYLESQNFKFPKTINDLNILSFALSETSNLDIISHIIKSPSFTKEYSYGLTPFEMALKMQYDFKLFKVLIDNDILENSMSKLPISHQILDNNEIEDTVRGAIFAYLLEEKNLNLNEDILNTEPLIVKAYKKEDYTLLFLFLFYGARIKHIANEYGETFEKDNMRAISNALLNNQPKEDYKYFLPFLSYEDLKYFLDSLTTTKDMQILLCIAKNNLFNNKCKIELFDLALQKGCDINEINDDAQGQNVLQYICENFIFGKNIETVEFLFEKGAIFNLNKKQPLVFCINGNETHLIRYLVEKQNIDINELDCYGHGAINGFIDDTYLDTLEKQIEMINLLVKLGLDINQKVIGLPEDDYPKSSIIDILIADKKSHPFIEYLLKTYEELELGRITSFIFKHELNDELCKLVIEKDPYFEYDAYFVKKFKKKEYRYSAQFLEMAIDWQRKELAEYLIDTYPQMRGYHENISLISLAYNKNFSNSFIKKLILKDTNLNREYKSEDKFGITISETSLIRVLRYTVEEKYVDDAYELIDFMIDNGADANIPLKKYNIPDYYLDEEGALICASLDNDISIKLFDLLIDKGNVKPNIQISNLNQTQIQSIMYTRDLDDEHKLEALKYFHKKCGGLNLVQQDRKGYNLFLFATSNCLPKCLQYLIDLGSDIHIIGGEDNSPAIHKAISNYYFVDKTKRAQTVKVLIDAGVDFEQFDSEQLTAVMSAAKYGCFEALVTLLENGAKANSKNKANSNATNVLITEDYLKTEHFYSYDDRENIEENKSKILAVLKDYGCDLDNVPLEGSTILNNSIGFNLKTIFNTLLQLEVDINKPDKNGITPIMVAIEFSDLFFANTLLQSEDINLLVEDNNGENLIFKAIKRGNDSNIIDLIDYLKENGVPFKNLENGMNPLIFASYFCHFNLFEYLLNFVDDINTKDNFGLSAISWSLQSNLNIPQEQRVESIKTLISLGADINTLDNQERTLLHLCVITHCDLVFEYLVSLENSIDINQKDSNGDVAISLLIQNYFEGIYDNNNDFFEYFFTKLISSGANIEDAKSIATKYEEDSYLKSFMESF
ncbi:hypothetical protein CRU98_11960 [Arcobacter sp. CECT 8986]|uniref:ankyrin repeat domain-containing protein n=1 Tax=Arcobacter sp. CECT 8986 TaxID=2044507 RepID=UPI001009F73D|nr:ankyrin repeat domain-containing protein [Arcobacter sp. CECT 8986]RXJ97836.1 hypothetical protein CRU98_11960 [Arcobacter sp. CECT 8986]